MIENLHEIELVLIQKLHEVMRSPLFDTFFRGWDFIDRAEFMILLIPAVYLLVSRKIGIRLLLLVIVSACINKICKFSFGQPRPSHLSPELSIINHTTPGFPSGAAQTAVILSGLIYLECKNKIVWILGFLFATCLCFSRIYLGVHFPSDILGGMLIGLLLMRCYTQMKAYESVDSTTLWKI